MSSPEISLIVPMHNAAGTIGELIGSIQAQTFEYFEAIFVDDGSTDDTASVVADAAIRDERLRLVTQVNAGPGAARNAGMRAARGRYLMFADADDVLLPDAMKHAFGRAEDAQADIVVFQMQHEDVQTGKISPSPDRWDPARFPAVFAGTDKADCLFTQFKNWPPDKLFRRSFIEEHDLVFPPLYRTEDLPFTCEALAIAQRIAPLDEELYRYRVNQADSSTSTRDDHPLDFLEACRLFHRYLVNNNLLETFRVDYTRWVGLCVYVNLMELRTYEGFHTVFDALKHGGLADFELLGQPDSAFLRPIHGQVVRAIDTQFFEHFLFDLWRLDADKALHYDELADELTSVQNSTSLKVGQALVSGPKNLIDGLLKR
jgi:glycosyltransferase involved in cell wall biosynthesis